MNNTGTYEDTQAPLPDENPYRWYYIELQFRIQKTRYHEPVTRVYQTYKYYQRFQDAKALVTRWKRRIDPTVYRTEFIYSDIQLMNSSQDVPSVGYPAPHAL